VTAIALPAVAAYLDSLLRIAATPDYPHALNGVQVEHRGPVRSIASSVDCSERVITEAVAGGANLLLVHHGLFWAGLRPIAGHLHRRLHLLLEHDVALYAAHLPLDAHEEFGNAVLLARELGLTPGGGFARYETINCGVRGECDVATSELVSRARAFAAAHGGTALATACDNSRRTRRWAICTGAGVNHSTLDEAASQGVDTLITGEGPHWSAVEAPERGLVIIFAGHYATETPGVRALGAHLGERFGLDHRFVAAPTGL
jgi:dinuclear metal center YbgI/SA1388 family protein